MRETSGQRTAVFGCSNQDRKEGVRRMGMNNFRRRGNRRRIWAGAAIVFVVCAVLCMGAVWAGALNQNRVEQEYRDLAESTASSQKTIEIPPASEESIAAVTPEPYHELKEMGVPIPEKEIDFEDLQQNVNGDIYAWLYIPDSTIDFPVLQHPTDNSHYLNYNLDGSKGYPGCIFSEKYNAKDFRDPLTVLYGHVMDTTGTMFAGLHKFRDSEYLEEHPYIYIYLPDKLYVYEIFAAYEYTNVHLLYGNDYTDAAEFLTYIEEIMNLRDMNCVRKEGIELSVDDRILTLSTCITGKPKNRYLVQGVLLNGD